MNRENDDMTRENTMRATRRTKAADGTTVQRAPIRREDILEEASKLFAAKGYNGTNLKEVADRLGCTRQALYYHFVNKDEIVQELVQSAFDSMTEVLAPLITPALPPLERLAQMLHEYARMCLTRQAVFSVYYNRRHTGSEESFEAINSRERSDVDAMSKVIEQWQKDNGREGDFPPRTMVLFLIGVCNSTLAWYRPDGRDDVDTIVNYVVRFALQGMTGEPYPLAGQSQADAQASVSDAGTANDAGTVSAPAVAAEAVPATAPAHASGPRR
jgi:AcrR family transcriptional regulator